MNKNECKTITRHVKIENIDPEHIIEEISACLRGVEREILDDFSEAFFASKVLKGHDVKDIIEKFVLNVQHDYTLNNPHTKYWYSLKDDHGMEKTE